MTSEYKIRPALAADCSSIYDQMKKLAEFGNFTLKLELDEFIENGFGDGHPPYFYALVAEKCADKSIAGYLLYYHSYSSLEGKSLFSENIYVDPNSRGKGIASAPLEYLCRFAFENKFMRIGTGILKSNQASIKLHQAFGAVDLCEAIGKVEYRIDFRNITETAKKPPRYV